MGDPAVSLSTAVPEGGSEPPEPGESLRFTHTLRPSSYWLLSLKNGLLNVVTLTLWRFWGKTEVRSRVWRSIRLNGESFEYTGRGVELFVGFVLALVVLGIPFLLVVFGGQLMGPAFAAMILLPLYVFAFWLWGLGTFTAFRYMASRTTWRGVRFRLAGSAKAYGWKFLWVTILSALTANWYGPAGQRQLAQGLWDGMSFGDRRLRFSMTRSERIGLYGPFALGWFGTGLVAFVATILFGMMVNALGPEGANLSVPDWAMQSVFMYGFLVVFYPLFALVWAPYEAALLRSVAAGIVLDRAVFKLEVGAIPLWWLTVTNVLLALISFGFLLPLVQARTARFIVSRLVSAGTAEISEARQTSSGPRSGEGLADAFGFSAI